MGKSRSFLNVQHRKDNGEDMPIITLIYGRHHGLAKTTTKKRSMSFKPAASRISKAFNKEQEEYS